MGKANKNKKARANGGGSTARYNPYGRDTTRVTDLCNMLSKTVASVKAAPDMDDDAEEEQQGALRREEEEEAGGGEEEGGVPTRGKIVQRHKREWKELRSRLEEMKAQKKRMGTATLAKKNAKKDLANEIKRMMDDMTERHKEELAAFDAEAKEGKEAEMETEAKTHKDGKRHTQKQQHTDAKSEDKEMDTEMA